MSTCLKNTLKTYLIVTIVLAAILIYLFVVDYMDLSTVAKIYLPIWIVAFAISLFGGRIFSVVFALFAAMGLLVEYLVHLLQGDRPTMSGAFLNIVFLVLGLLLGVAFQRISSRRKRS